MSSRTTQDKDTHQYTARLFRSCHAKRNEHEKLNISSQTAHQTTSKDRMGPRSRPLSTATPPPPPPVSQETDLAAKCTAPFVPADVSAGIEASAMCCTSDLTLAELKTLCGKTNYFNSTATTVEGYLGRGTESSRTNPYSACGTLISHIESIELFGGLGAKFIPELKTPMVDMVRGCDTRVCRDSGDTFWGKAFMTGDACATR